MNQKAAETLYLFDIDGTLVDTGGAGMTALKQASSDMFGDLGPALDLAGSTDLSIVQNIFSHFQEEETEEKIQRYFFSYLDHLERNLQDLSFKGKELGEVRDLLDCLNEDENATLGLLTGNIAGGAAAKMRRYQMSHYFSFGAYGCDFADRNRLGPLARAKAHCGKVFAPENIWVIGDTPKDIACAHAFGARCLAVATGQFDEAQLHAHQADLVVSSLHADIYPLFAWN